MNGMVLRIRRLINLGYNNNNNNMIHITEVHDPASIHSLQYTNDQQLCKVLKYTAIIVFRMYIYVSPSGIYKVLFIYFVNFLFTFWTSILIRECVSDWRAFNHRLLSPLSRIYSYCT